jgi:hypothetical protein
MRAAFSHSLSSAVGQYSSRPKVPAAVAGLAAGAFLGEASLSAQLKTLLSDLGLEESGAAVGEAGLRSHEGSRAETRCIVRIFRRRRRLSLSTLADERGG